MPSYSFSHHDSKKTWTSVQKITGRVIEFSVMVAWKITTKHTTPLCMSRTARETDRWEFAQERNPVKEMSHYFWGYVIQ